MLSVVSNFPGKTGPYRVSDLVQAEALMRALIREHLDSLGGDWSSLGTAFITAVPANGERVNHKSTCLKGRLSPNNRTYQLESNDGILCFWQNRHQEGAHWRPR